MGLVWVEIWLHGKESVLIGVQFFSNLRGLSGIERRKYLNNCWARKFKKVGKIVDELLNVDPDSHICTEQLCNLLTNFNNELTFHLLSFSHS